MFVRCYRTDNIQKREHLLNVGVSITTNADSASLHFIIWSLIIGAVVKRKNIAFNVM